MATYPYSSPKLYRFQVILYKSIFRLCLAFLTVVVILSLLVLFYCPAGMTTRARTVPALV